VELWNTKTGIPPNEPGCGVAHYQLTCNCLHARIYILIFEKQVCKVRNKDLITQGPSRETAPLSSQGTVLPRFEYNKLLLY